GKVSAHNNLESQAPVILTPNDKVYFEGTQMTLTPVNVKKYVAWVQGQLVFVDDSFGVIANKLERKFNLKINNSFSELQELNITATFKDESIDQILQTFQTYISFEYTIENGVVTIQKPK